MFATPLSGAAWARGADSACAVQARATASIETTARMATIPAKRNLLLTIESFPYSPIPWVPPTGHMLPALFAIVVSCR